MLCAVITALVVNKASLFVAPDHPLPKSPRSEEKRQKLNAGYSCKRCRYDLKQQQQQQKKNVHKRAQTSISNFVVKIRRNNQAIELQFSKTVLPS